MARKEVTLGVDRSKSKPFDKLRKDEPVPALTFEEIRGRSAAHDALFGMIDDLRGSFLTVLASEEKDKPTVMTKSLDQFTAAVKAAMPAWVGKPAAVVEPDADTATKVHQEVAVVRDVAPTAKQQRQAEREAERQEAETAVVKVAKRRVDWILARLDTTVRKSEGGREATYDELIELEIHRLARADTTEGFCYEQKYRAARRDPLVQALDKALPGEMRTNPKFGLCGLPHSEVLSAIADDYPDAIEPIAKALHARRGEGPAGQKIRSMVEIIMKADPKTSYAKAEYDLRSRHGETFAARDAEREEAIP